MLLELALALAQPRVPSLPPPPDDVLGLELNRHLRFGLGRPRLLVRALTLSLGLAEELPPTLRGAQLLRQLIAALLAVELVLGLVGRPGLGQDLPGDLIEGVIDLRAGVPGDPGAIDRHHAGLDQARPVTQLQHLGEQIGQRPLMPTDKPRDRRMIGNQVARDHPVGHVLTAVTLDRPRRPHLGRKRVQDQRHQHRRLIRRATMTIEAVGGIESRQIHARHRVDDEPRQMIGRQPLPDIRRQQEPLLATALNEVLRHTGKRLKRHGRSPLRDSLRL